MSAPSITAMPTAKPPATTRTQHQRDLKSASAAIAKNAIPIVIAWDATPQQAAEKNPEFSIAASAPSRHAIGASLSCRNKVQAPNPRIISAMGTSNLANPTGPNK